MAKGTVMSTNTTFAFQLPFPDENTPRFWRAIVAAVDVARSLVGGVGLSLGLAGIFNIVSLIAGLWSIDHETPGLVVCCLGCNRGRHYRRGGRSPECFFRRF